MSKTKILRIIARLNIGGPAIHTILLTAGLNNQRFESALVTGVEGKYEGNMLDLAAAKGVKPIIIPQLRRNVDPLGGLIALFKLYRLMRREKPHIVHTHTATAGLLGRLAARLAGVPVILHTFHGHVLHGYFGPLRSKALVWTERFLARLSDRIVTVSEGQRRDLAGYGVVPLQKITVVHLGFELEALLDAVARVQERTPAIRLLLVGDGDLRGDLEAQARSLGLSETVTFAGHRTDVPKALAVFDVFVLPSLWEGMPNVVLEAMAAGLPVVATAVGGTPEVVVDGVTGFLVPPRDPDALAEAITRLLRDPDLRRKMGQAGQKRIEQHFSIEETVRQTEALYEALLREKGY